MVIWSALRREAQSAAEQKRPRPPPHRGCVTGWQNGRTYKSDEGTLVSIGNTYSGNLEIGVKDNVAVGTKVYSLGTVTKSQIVSTVSYATGATTMNTKLATVSKDSFSLLAKNMLEGNDTIASSAPIPYTSNFDEVDAVNGGSAAVQFQTRYLINQ